MGNAVRFGQGVLGVAVAALFFCVSTVAAARITSPNYQIDGNLGGSFGGSTGSSSYTMTSLGGEAVVGNGSSGSYILDQQQTSPSAETMQLGVQPAGLVGFYPMDENAGTSTADASRYQNDGTLYSDATWGASGKIGSAVNMNGLTPATGPGSTGAVRIPDSSNFPSGSAMTIEAWVKQDSIWPYRAIASHWFVSQSANPDSASWELEVSDDGKLRMYIANSQTDGGGNSVATASGAWNTPGVWRHVAVVYDGVQSQADRVKIFLDGTRMNTTVTGTIASSLQDSSAPLVIGDYPDTQQSFNGSIDHVKVFNRALSVAEVAAEYTAQNAGSSSGFGLEPAPSASINTPIDAIVRTNSPNYTIGVQQDHDLQSGANTIPAIGGSIGSPATWVEGTTRGFGFTLTAAPALDTKWSSGSRYAALPNSVTTFYNGTGNANKTPEVVSLQLRLHPAATQPLGTYNNAVTYTGTMTP